MPGGAAQARLENAPKPPSFLDPLFSVDDCYHYSVPSFCEANHPLTSWLLKRIISLDVEALKRKLEVSPKSLCNRYFQVLDDPEVYTEGRLAGSPMFHTKCLLYLTPLGIALYFKSLEAVNLFLSFRTPTNAPVTNPDEAQFASHLQDTTTGDFHAFNPFIVLMRRQFFEASVPLQLGGWRPDRPFAMPLRRRYERRAIYCRDWLDAALSLLSCRPVYPIASLVLSITANPLYRFSRLPLVAVKPPTAEERAAAAKAKAKSKKAASAASGKKAAGGKGKGGKSQPPPDTAIYTRWGNMPVEDKPHDVPMVGVKSLLQLCTVYDRLRQTRSTALQVRDLMREATAAGLNTEILLMQAEECIAPDKRPADDNLSNAGTGNSQASHQGPRQPRRLMWRLNKNNHAKKEKKKKKQQPQLSAEEMEHCSEPLRILLFCLLKDKNGTSLPQCLEAVNAYVKRNYFGCPEPLPFEHGRSRDTRNIIVSLLNLIWREQSAIDKIIERIRAGDQRWRALETAKQQRTGTIAKVSGLMTSVLTASKQIVSFLANKDFPPYPASTVDFNVDSQLANSMTSVQYGVVRDLNGCKESWKFLTKDMLAQVVQDSAVLLHFKVGKRPTKEQMEEYRQLLEGSMKKKKDEK